MSIIKSFSVGNGDTFYIEHGSDNFTIIDCNLSEDNKKRIVDEIIDKSSNKDIVRFVSTHPDNDHIRGLEYLNSRKEIVNFYCVENKATKPEETTDFNIYCKLRDSTKAFKLFRGCRRKWMNENGEVDGKDHGSSGLNILWPGILNEHYKKNLQLAADGKAFNNISIVMSYSLENGVKALWMGDLEFAFMELIKDDIQLPAIDILFAPHHGRKSGEVPSDLLKKLNPKIIIIGEAPSKDLNYYQGYNTITQNSAGDITFVCEGKSIDIYVSSYSYSVNFLANNYYSNNYGGYYLGTLNL